MNRKQIETEIVMAHTYNDLQKIHDIYIDLVNMRAKLDRWFNKYLDMFDEKMTSSTRSDPVWKLYHKKSDEYSDVVQTIKTAEYYIKKA
jgi:hypothetical protein